MMDTEDNGLSRVEVVICPLCGERFVRKTFMSMDGARLDTLDGDHLPECGWDTARGLSEDDVKEAQDILDEGRALSLGNIAELRASIDRFERVVSDRTAPWDKDEMEVMADAIDDLGKRFDAVVDVLDRAMANADLTRGI